MVIFWIVLGFILAYVWLAICDWALDTAARVWYARPRHSIRELALLADVLYEQITAWDRARWSREPASLCATRMDEWVDDWGDIYRPDDTYDITGPDDCDCGGNTALCPGACIFEEPEPFARPDTRHSGGTRPWLCNPDPQGLTCRDCNKCFDPTCCTLTCTPRYTGRPCDDGCEED